jgi:transposase
MQLKTLLNRVHPLKSFVYTEARFVDAGQALAIEVVIVPRANSRPVCSNCGQRRTG